jgi:hypothetical protein
MYHRGFVKAQVLPPADDFTDAEYLVFAAKSKRNFGDQVSPVVRSVIRPDQNQGLNHVADWRVLRDDEKHSRARSAGCEKRGKGFRHCPLVVAYQNSRL